MSVTTEAACATSRVRKCAAIPGSAGYTMSISNVAISESRMISAQTAMIRPRETGPFAGFRSSAMPVPFQK